MGLMDWLRGKGRSQTGAHADGEFFRIPARDFFGWFRRSPNGRFVITWLDANEDGTRGGARPSGKARYFLLDGPEIVAEGHLERPNDGKVADNGTFIFNDWKFSADLSGEFYAFDGDGRLILSKTVSANLYNNGLATDGRLAVCQTCNSPTEDGSVLTVFDLEAGVEIARWIPESGWAESYAFPEDGLTLRLCYSGGTSFAYSLQGTFLDRDRWIDWSLSKGDLSVVEKLLKESDKKPSADLAARLIAGIDTALATRRPGNEHTRAWAYKLRGTCLEAQGKPSEALQCYESALQLDAKIGVKRRADALRKMLGG